MVANLQLLLVCHPTESLLLALWGAQAPAWDGTHGVLWAAMGQEGMSKLSSVGNANSGSEFGTVHHETPETRTDSQGKKLLRLDKSMEFL